MIRASPIIPDMKEAFFRCLVCDYTVSVQVDRGRILEPTRCEREECGSENSMSLVHNRCTFSDKQVARMQETPGKKKKKKKKKKQEKTRKRGLLCNPLN
jgi:DNA replication licensing factor MCM4